MPSSSVPTRPNGAGRDGLRALGVLPHDDHGLAKTRCLLLHAAAIGQDQGLPVITMVAVRSAAQRGGSGVAAGWQRGRELSMVSFWVDAADGFVPDSAECKMGPCAMGPRENRSGDPDPSAESPPAPSSRPFKRRAVELGAI